MSDNQRKKLIEAFPKWEKRVMTEIHEKDDDEEIRESPGHCELERRSLSSLGEWTDCEDDVDMHDALMSLQDICSPDNCGEYCGDSLWLDEDDGELTLRSVHEAEPFSADLAAPRLRRQSTVSSYINCNGKQHDPPRLPEPPFLLESTSMRCEGKPNQVFRVLQNALERDLDADTVVDAEAFKLRALWNGGQDAGSVMFVVRVFHERMPLSSNGLCLELQRRSGDAVAFFAAVQHVERALNEANGVKVTFSRNRSCVQRPQLPAAAESVEPLLDLVLHETDDTIRLQAAHSVHKTIMRLRDAPASFWSETGVLSSLLTALEELADGDSEARAAIAASISTLMSLCNSDTPLSTLQWGTERLCRIVQSATAAPWSATVPNWLAGLGGSSEGATWATRLGGSLERRVLRDCTSALAKGLLQLGVNASQSTVRKTRSSLQRIRCNPDERIATAAQHALRVIAPA